jgi:hypothetical protein
LPESSVTTTKLLNVPLCVGAKLTLMEQELPAESDAGQLLVCAKPSPPVVMIDEIFKGELPVLDKTRVCAALVVPTCCAANVRDPGEKEAIGAVPVPAKEKVCVLPATAFESSVIKTLPETVPGCVG